MAGVVMQLICREVVLNAIHILVSLRNVYMPRVVNQITHLQLLARELHLKPFLFWSGLEYIKTII